MLTNLYKNYYIQKFSMPLSVFGVVLIVFLATLYYYGVFSSNLAEAFKIRTELSAKAQSLDTEIKVLKASYEIWTVMQSKNFEATGLQIENARKLIEQARLKNRINTLQVNLSNPLIRTDYTGQKYSQIEYAEISMNCGAYTDYSIYSFLNELINTMPGHIQILELRISVSESIKQSVLTSIATGGYKDLVQGRIRLIWQDIKKVS